ncbi:MAG: hypothetical protein ACLQIQ_03605 [Beijerinckiaceae bacterium]
MSIIRLDFRKFLRVVLSILAGLVVIAALQRAARAADTHVIIVPADDGYGTQECFLQTKGCGEVVAAAWCEAMGFASPVAFGRAEDITSTIAGQKEVKLDPDSFVVKCAE